MIKLTKQGNSYNTPIEEYIADTEADLQSIPDKAPVGSYVLIIETSDVKIKNSAGNWVSL